MQMDIKKNQSVQTLNFFFTYKQKNGIEFSSVKSPSSLMSCL